LFCVRYSMWVMKFALHTLISSSSLSRNPSIVGNLQDLCHRGLYFEPRCVFIGRTRRPVRSLDLIADITIVYAFHIMIWYFPILLSCRLWLASFL
jgi:hypothetical protein